MRLRELFEAPKKRAAFALGRMNPATTGHELLVNAIKQAPGDSFLFLTDRAPKLPDNPLTAEEKLDWARKSFNGIAIGLARTVLTAADRLYKMGYREITFLEGEDKLYKLLLQYNGIAKEMHDYNFDKIDYVQLSRDAAADDATGMSGTKLRGYVTNNDLEKFKKGVTASAQPYAEDMFKKLQGIMGVDPVGETVEEGWFGFGDPELLPEPEWLDAKNKQLWSQKQPNEDDDRFIIQLRNYTNMANNHLIDDANMGLRFELESLKRNVTEVKNMPVAKKIEPVPMPTPPKAPDATIPRSRDGYVTDDGVQYKQDKYDENIMHVSGGFGTFTYDGNRVIKWTTPRLNGYSQIHDLINKTITVDADTTVKSPEGADVVVSTKAIYDLDGNLKDGGELGMSLGDVNVGMNKDTFTMGYTISDNLSMHVSATRGKASDKEMQNIQAMAQDAKGFKGTKQPLVDLAKMVKSAGGNITFKSPANQGAIPYNQGMKMLASMTNTESISETEEEKPFDPITLQRILKFASDVERDNYNTKDAVMSTPGTQEIIAKAKAQAKSERISNTQAHAHSKDGVHGQGFKPVEFDDLENYDLPPELKVELGRGRKDVGQ